MIVKEEQNSIWKPCVTPNDGNQDGLESCDCDGIESCTDSDGDGYYASFDCPNGGDCADTLADCAAQYTGAAYTYCINNLAGINPGVTEICDNGVDDECDVLVDCNDPDCAEDPVCTAPEFSAPGILLSLLAMWVIGGWIMKRYH